MPTEHNISFEGTAGRLHGILHEPDTPDARTAVVFVHGWSGNRCGPHRMFVKTARQLAADGFLCLRFDLRGRGESEGTVADGTIAAMIEDVCLVVRQVSGRQDVERIVLLGICSGGKVAIGAAASGALVDALVLWSAEPMGALADGEREQRRTRAAAVSYLRKALHPATWKKLLTGRVNTGMVKKAVFKQEKADAVERRQEDQLLKQFRSFRGPILFVYGGNDPDTRTAAAGYESMCGSAGIEATFHEIAEANHSFYGQAWEAEVMERTVNWLGQVEKTWSNVPESSS